MSYPQDLDEIPEDQLRAELNRRRLVRITGHCDYCMKDPSNSPPCKFPERHVRS